MSYKHFTLAERGKLEFMLDKEKIALDHWMTQLVAGKRSFVALRMTSFYWFHGSSVKMCDIAHASLVFY